MSCKCDDGAESPIRDLECEINSGFPMLVYARKRGTEIQREEKEKQQHPRGIGVGDRFGLRKETWIESSCRASRLDQPG